MSQQRIKRHQVIQRCILGRLSKQEAAELLNLSPRQIQRLKKRVKEADLLGVIHGNQGRVPFNKMKPEVYAKLKQLLLGAWSNLNTLHVRDKLKEDYGISVSRETIRQVFKRLSISRRKHKRGRRFNRRERKPMEGMLLQMDGSFHDWFLTGEKCTLIAAIDDATNEVPWAEFFDRETSLNYLAVLKCIVERKGIFCALYVDRHSSFKTIRMDWTNRKTFRREDFDETHVAQTLLDLGIEMISAKTPQAKGRIERLFQTFQDRLLKEMQLRGIKNKEEANRFLQGEWLASHNRRFRKIPTSSESAYRTIPDSVNLKEIFCLKLPRLVKNDNTISYASRLYKILADPYRASYARATVEVRIYPDHAMTIAYQNRLLDFKPIDTTPTFTNVTEKETLLV